MAAGGTAIAAAGIDGVACCSRLLGKDVVEEEADEHLGRESCYGRT